MPVAALRPAGVDLTLEELLERQSGVARLDQLALWLDRRQVAAEVAAGRWQRLGRGLVVAHNAALTDRQHEWRVLLGATRGAALGGLTAARLDGFAGFEPRAVDVVLPVGGVASQRSGAVVHFSSRLGPEDVHPLRAPRRTRLPRSLVDAASWAASERLARALLLSVVQQRLVRGADLLGALARRGPCRRHALVVECVRDAGGGIASLPEHDFEVLRRRWGLPRPDRQVAVRRGDGRYYLDVEWTAYGLALEVHGVQHAELVQWERDLDRLFDLTVGGRRVLQVTSYAVRHEADRLGPRLVAALESRGWRA